MTKLTFAWAGAILLFGTAGAVHAHHSAAQFDFQNTVNLTGVVKEARFSNPHAHIVLTVTDARGERDIEFEGHSRNNYYRSGWRPHMVNVGDRVTLGIAPLRDSTDGGYVLSVTTANGDKF
jgi:hypothetical protein